MARLPTVGHWRRDLVTGEISWSAELYRMYGYEPDTIVPSFELVLERTHSDDREALARRDVAVRDHATTIDHERRIVRPDEE